MSGCPAVGRNRAGLVAAGDALPSLYRGPTQSTASCGLPNLPNRRPCSRCNFVADTGEHAKRRLRSSTTSFGPTPAHIAKASGISRQCVHTWISRYAVERVSGFRIHPRVRNPHRNARPRPWCRQMLATRRVLRRRQDWLAPELVCRLARSVASCAVTTSPTYAIATPMTGLLIKASKATPLRYEREPPAELFTSTF